MALSPFLLVLITAKPDRMVGHHALTLQMTMTSPLIGHLMDLPLIPKELLLLHVANIFGFNPTSIRSVTTKLRYNIQI